MSENSFASMNMPNKKLSIDDLDQVKIEESGSIEQAEKRGWELIGYSSYAGWKFKCSTVGFQMLTSIRLPTLIEAAVWLPDMSEYRKSIEQPETQKSNNGWITGMFLEIEDYEQFCPIPGRIRLDDEGEIIDTDIGPGVIDDADMHDGFDFTFKAKGDTDVYQR